LADAAAGKIWSARFEGVQPQPASIATEVTVEPARAEDLPAIAALLAAAGLPTDVAPHLRDFLVARHEGRVVGCAGMEARGADALFRSLAVDHAYRGAGLGRRLYAALVEYARGKGVRRAYLLTTTIVSLAESWGFQRVARDQVPDAIRDTTQFHGACCASAVAMWKDLTAESAKCCSCS
jgi:amino-acid N-acetyltransferase